MIAHLPLTRLAAASLSTLARLFGSSAGRSPRAALGQRRPTVKLIEGWTPRTAEERFLSRKLATRREVPLDRLVDDLAEKLLEAAVGDNGAAIDAGIWGRWVFRDQALRLIRTCPGLTIGKPNE